MKLNNTINNDLITIFLKGRIDSNNAVELEEALTQTLQGQEDKDIVLDASDLEYISSAGLRALLKLSKQYKKKLVICEVSLPVYEIFETTGFTEIFDVKKEIRKISVDGCDIIGKGFFGTVYRIDDETIVKVYNCEDAIERIQNEKKMAKAAFVKGLPTAISYDMVKVGDRYGSVFEMIKSKTFNDLVIDYPGDADKYINIYVDFIKKVHETKMDKDVVPSAKETYMGYLEVIKDLITEKQYGFLKDNLQKIPESLNLVHGDLQMKNVMMMEGEPMLIDMDTLSTGQPEFDLAGLYVTYKLFGEDDPGNSMSFLGITNEMSEHIWNSVETMYYEGNDEDIRAQKIVVMKTLAYIRFLFIISGMEPDELRELRIRHTGEHIDELAEQ